MKEPQRKERNTQRLAELYPAFGRKIRRVIEALEQNGLRPRIQDAYRSPEDQLKAYESGHSKLKYGFHNVTGAGGAKEALAVDMLDDDNPLRNEISAATRSRGGEAGSSHWDTVGGAEETR